MQLSPRFYFEIINSFGSLHTVMDLVPRNWRCIAECKSGEWELNICQNGYSVVVFLLYILRCPIFRYWSPVLATPWCERLAVASRTACEANGYYRGKYTDVRYVWRRNHGPHQNNLKRARVKRVFIQIILPLFWCSGKMQDIGYIWNLHVIIHPNGFST